MGENGLVTVAGRMPNVSILHVSVLNGTLSVKQVEHTFIPDSTVPRRCATYFIVSFFRFFAQSSRYCSTSLWQGSPASSASPSE